MVVPHCKRCLDERRLIYTDYKVLAKEGKPTLAQVTYVCNRCSCSSEAFASCEWKLPLSRYYATLVV